MNEIITLWSIGPFSLTAFGICISLGAVLAVVLTCLIHQKNLGIDTCLNVSVAALLGALLGGRLVYCATMLEFILVDMGGVAFIPQLWQGGYTLYGAVLGGMLGVWLYARGTKKPAAQLLDAAAPGAALALMVERAAEYFTSQGLGDYLEEGAMTHFPFAVQNIYEEWQIPVFFWESMAALVLLIVVLCLRGRVRDGRLTEVFLALLGLTQVILESLREDEFIRFGFVRFTQLAAAFTMGAVLYISLRRCVKAVGWTKWQIGRTALFFLGVAVLIGIEFALDKSSIDNVLLYFVMAATLAMMGFALLKEGRSSLDRR